MLDPAHHCSDVLVRDSRYTPKHIFRLDIDIAHGCTIQGPNRSGSVTVWLGVILLEIFEDFRGGVRRRCPYDSQLGEAQSQENNLCLNGWRRWLFLIRSSALLFDRVFASCSFPIRLQFANRLVKQGMVNRIALNHHQLSTYIKRKCLVFFEFNEQNGVLVMGTHHFTLSIPAKDFEQNLTRNCL